MGKPGKRIKDGDQQIWVRPLSGDRFGVGLLNMADGSGDITVRFADVSPSLAGKSVTVRDLWNHKDLGTFKESATVAQIGAHDTAFLLLKIA
jgi:alpha-galactosidase